MKLKIFLSNGKTKKVMIPQFEGLNQQNFDYVLRILRDEHNVDPHSITMIKERKSSFVN